jgi:hypothetical protein
MTNIECRIPNDEPKPTIARLSTAFFLLVVVAVASGRAGDLQWVKVSEDKKGFVLAESGDRFVPWGFNYDHDDKGRLLEDYWNLEWSTVEEDFGEMKQLGANVVRIHLQLGRFMKGPNEPNEASLEQLGRVVDLAERLHIYLDITGLGCYHKKDVPQWYDELSEQRRWDVQGRFWESVAKRCADSCAVFCYDLMNEPVVGGRGKRTDWLGPAFAGKHFVQFIAIQQGSRERPAIAVQWIRELSAAIRRHDRRHLITVGLVPWSLPGKAMTSGFEPEKVAEELDFISVHLYPESGKVTEKIEMLKGFCVGRPVVIEEMFPLKCSVDELGRFVEDSRKFASGWVGFYWGKTPQEYKERGRLVDMITLGWLEFFESHAKKTQN